MVFKALHHDPDGPLILPNAWDHASAAALAGQGFAAIGTTSLGVAAAAGLPDGHAATREETLRLARRLGGGAFLLSVDAEGGFSDDPAEVAGLARELAQAGAVGINLEDGRADGTLTPAPVHAAKIAAVKAAVPDLFVNARTDTYWLPDPRTAREPETRHRLDAYRQAGADGVFVPGLTDPAAIQELVAYLRPSGVPLNILYSPTGPTVSELAALGVRRVSLGSLLFRAALGAAVTAALDIRAGRYVAAPAAPTYGEVQELSGGGDATEI
ncbi:isocitrate lyase/phosphoenolpyruvate mutase family protein [Streptomyces sp. NBC_01474]|uniref:isocitrate lyase/PEP mutase family protein n=1 Tax=unclassified Streptomyces TaxID=2593676 RepID=UPI002DDA9661|nr:MULTISPECIES: isocitrate lyase/phosphoenolpyruvate mutase family protein [unclassified Streptomyces]WSD97358.1 isocitrate lyase/phosphoenolpyruvate mutase family protein [Streptomyces sp. NBC_01474]